MAESRFGRYLRFLREQKGWTTRVLASQIGCTAAFITQLEQGHRRTTPIRVWQLMQVLGGSFRYALAALCADFGVPEEIAAPIAGEEWTSIPDTISSGTP